MTSLALLKMPLTEYESFLQKQRKKKGDKLVPSTIERYMQFLHRFYSEMSKYNDPQLLIEYMALKIKEVESPVIYSAFKNYLYYLGFTDEDPLLLKIKYPQIHANAMRSERFLQSKVLSVAELQTLFTSLYASQDDDKLAMMVSWLYDTACRRSELFAIKHEHVVVHDPPKPETPNIWAEIHILGKGQKARVVYLNKTSYMMYKALRAKEPDAEYVFRLIKKGSKKAYKYQVHELYKLIVKRSETILGRHIHPHCFRHTKLTHLADAGGDGHGIMRYAGHSDFNTTKIYIMTSTWQGRRVFNGYSRDIADPL